MFPVVFIIWVHYDLGGSALNTQWPLLLGFTMTWVDVLPFRAYPVVIISWVFPYLGGGADVPSTHYYLGGGVLGSVITWVEVLTYPVVIIIRGFVIYWVGSLRVSRKTF